ncbi:hypothetical protein [Azospirillum argentinense]
MDLRDQTVENPNPVAAGEECPGDVAADETGATSDKNGFSHEPLHGWTVMFATAISDCVVCI